MKNSAYVKLVEICTFRSRLKKRLTWRWSFIILHPFCSSLLPCNGFWFIWWWTRLLCIIGNLHTFFTEEGEGMVRLAWCLFLIFFPLQFRCENCWKWEYCAHFSRCRSVNKWEFISVCIERERRIILYIVLVAGSEVAGGNVNDFLCVRIQMRQMFPTEKVSTVYFCRCHSYQRKTAKNFNAPYIH